MSLEWTLSNPVLCMDSEVILDIIVKFLEFPTPESNEKIKKNFTCYILSLICH